MSSGEESDIPRPVFNRCDSYYYDSQEEEEEIELNETNWEKFLLGEIQLPMNLDSLLNYPREHHSDDNNLK